MNAQAKTVGEQVGYAMDYFIATDRLSLCSTPVAIEMTGRNDAEITVYGCFASPTSREFADVQLRIRVRADGSVDETQGVRFFSSQHGAMTIWHEMADYEIDDFIHHVVRASVDATTERI